MVWGFEPLLTTQNQFLAQGQRWEGQSFVNGLRTGLLKR
jgi:hypothetical protein